MTVRLTGLLYTLLRTERGFDRLPAPLRFRQTAADWDTQERERAEATAILGQLPSELDEVNTIVEQPDWWLAAAVIAPGGDFTHRIHVAGKDETAAVLQQHPGLAADTGGNVELSICASAEVPQRLLALLPPVPAGPSADTAAAQPVVEGEIRAVCASPAPSSPISTGELLHNSAGFGWVDQLDGRFLLDEAGVPTVPISAAVLEDKITALIASVQPAPEPVKASNTAIDDDWDDDDDWDQPRGNGLIWRDGAIVGIGAEPEPEPRFTATFRPRSRG